MQFSTEAREAQHAWKLTSMTLPDDAREPGQFGSKRYRFCLPPSHALLNLLPEARATVARFAADAVVWHQGVGAGPTNHLCSSQVMCVNALAPFARDPDALRWIFGNALGAIEFHPIRSDGGLVDFEWIGDHNLLGEWQDGVGTRGAKTTSVDAVVHYTSLSGRRELALIEWKYTEHYIGARRRADKQPTRDQRYQHLYLADDGVIHADKVEYHDLFVDPVYQLFRLTLLARELEKRGGYDRVRVVYCAPARNGPLLQSINDRHRKVGRDLVAFWTAMQVDPDRFVVIDAARFVERSAPTSAEFKARYGHIDGRPVPRLDGRLPCPTPARV